MPINAYTGLMGSGKSFECVSTVIVDAVRDGRRVVTNVDGIDNDEVRMFAHEKYSVPFDKLGHVDHCKNDDVQKSDFLPYGETVDTFCRAGDLVCIDEAWRFWGADSKILPQHFIFFREHRHYVHPITKVSCDLVVMVQDIQDLHRKLKYVIEMTIRTTKIKSFGMAKTYRVEIWEGYKIQARLRVSVLLKKYDSRIFPLYSSYEGGSGKELVVDDRQNILKSKKLWFIALGVVCMIWFSAATLWKFFNPKDLKTPSALPHNNSVPVSTAPIISKTPAFSSDWRIAGFFKINDISWVILQDGSGRSRFESPSSFNDPFSYTAIATIEGQRITAFSGAPVSPLPSSKSLTSFDKK